MRKRLIAPVVVAVACALFLVLMCLGTPEREQEKSCKDDLCGVACQTQPFDKVGDKAPPTPKINYSYQELFVIGCCGVYANQDEAPGILLRLAEKISWIDPWFPRIVPPD
ncbi:MAG: hypothetical protein WC242_02170 [Candidatus Paceibacterota bacterium]